MSNDAPDACASDAVGLFTYHPADDRWTWSAEMFALFGYEPGDVVPTTGVVLAHEHPVAHAEDDDPGAAEDVPAGAPDGLVALVERAARTTGPFGGYVRLVDSRQQPRVAVVMGEHLVAPGDPVGRLRGFVLDISALRRSEVDAAVTEALDAVVGQRAQIEQAKGALMAAYGLDADGAFDVLTGLSQRCNVKVRTLASTLLDALPVTPMAEPEMTSQLLAATLSAPVASTEQDVEVAVKRAREGLASRVDAAR